MARDIIEGESIYIPFRNGRSINDTKHKARMYRTLDAFQRHFPGDEHGIDNVVLLEYAPVVHGEWIDGRPYVNSRWKVCSVCHQTAPEPHGGYSYCPNCGADMRERRTDGHNR